MKLIFCAIFLMVSQLVSASLTLTKEEASFIHELNEKTFNSKKLVLDKDLCAFQNELAVIAGKEQLKCSQTRSEGSNTETGELKVKQTLSQAQGMTAVSISDGVIHDFSKSAEKTESSDFDEMMDSAIKKMKRDFP